MGALAEIGVKAHYVPLNDIASEQGKIGGAAQRRFAGGVLLHHVTMSYDIDAEKMGDVLRIGREKLSDKGTRSANKRVDPIRSQTGLARDQIIEGFLDFSGPATTRSPRPTPRTSSRELGTWWRRSSAPRSGPHGCREAVPGAALSPSAAWSPRYTPVRSSRTYASASGIPRARVAFEFGLDVVGDAHEPGSRTGHRPRLWDHLRG